MKQMNNDQRIHRELHNLIESDIYKTIWGGTFASSSSTTSVPEMLMNMREAKKAIDDIMPKFSHNLTTYGRVVTSTLLPRISPLKWWEKVLCWNPCNDFIVDNGIQVFVIPERDLIIAPPGFSL